MNDRKRSVVKGRMGKTKKTWQAKPAPSEALANGAKRTENVMAEGDGASPAAVF
jgi:hypothetical protein